MNSFSLLVTFITVQISLISSVLCQITHNITTGDNGLQSGNITTSNVPLEYLSSGILGQGCQVLEGECYTMILDSRGNSYLSDAGTNIDQDRQRIEIVTDNEISQLGEQWEYRWQSFVYSGTGTTDNFCHYWQIYETNDTGYTGPLFTLTASQGEVGLRYDRQTSSPLECGVMKFSHFEGNTLDHRLLLTQGATGEGEIIYRLQTNGTTRMYCYSSNLSTGSSGNTTLNVGFYRSIADSIKNGTVEVNDFYAWPSNESVFNSARLASNQFNNVSRSLNESGFFPGRTSWGWATSGPDLVNIPPMHFVFVTFTFTLGLLFL